MISQAAQITIFVRDLEEAKRFYTEKLGFEICSEIAFTATWSYLTVAPRRRNETVLELLKAETPEEEALIGRQAGSRVLIMSTTENIDQAYSQFIERGVVVHGEPRPVPGGRGVGFQDLYGNKFDLYQPDDRPALPLD